MIKFEIKIVDIRDVIVSKAAVHGLSHGAQKWHIVSLSVT